MNATSPRPQSKKKPVIPDDAVRLLPQFNQRLLQLSAQLNQLQIEVTTLIESQDDDSAQITALVNHLTDTQSTALLQRRLAEFTDAISVEHDQINYLGLKLTELASKDQIVRLAGTVSTQDQVTELLDTVKHLVRTQDLANRLSETREEHVAALLGTLQEIVTHRQRREPHDDRRTKDEAEAIHRTARGEFAADLLPALDGLEIALERARTIQSRQRQDYAAIVRSTQPVRSGDSEQPSSGLLDKLRSRVTTDELDSMNTQGTMPTPESMAATLNATEAWLNHLNLVYERFVALLTLEGIEPLPALNERFDPRYHMAVDSEIRTDVAQNTVVRELRRGYRQDQRVLRYAEVVIAHSPGSKTGNASSTD